MRGSKPRAGRWEGARAEACWQDMVGARAVPLAACHVEASDDVSTV